MLKSGGLLLVLAASPCCVAQEVAPSMHDDTTAVALAPESSIAIACCRIADGTAVTLEILEPLNSALVKRGDKFRLRLADPVSIDGNDVLAPGIEGVGEIIHAEKSRSGGKPGELLLAARFLQHSDTQIPLRGLKLGGKGKDNTNAAMATAFAIGPLALFVHGREIVIPAGTLAQAKIARDVDLPPKSGPDTPPSPTAVPASAANAAPVLAEKPASASQSSLSPAEPSPEGTTTQSTTNETTQEPKE